MTAADRSGPSRRSLFTVGAGAALAGFGVGTVGARGEGDGTGPPTSAPDATVVEAGPPSVGVSLSTDPDAGADNSAAIAEALRAGGGSLVVLPSGTFPIADTILVPDAPGAGLVGAGVARTTLFQAPGADLDAMVASTKWVENRAFAQVPSFVADLRLDGRAADQGGGLGHGLLLMTFGSLVQRVSVVDTRGDGFHLANGTADGTQIGNDAPENRYVDCEARFCGGYGLHAPFTPGSGPPGTTDTFVERFICQQPGLGYIRSARAGGWKITAAQLYSTTEPAPTLEHGVDLQGCYGTTVADCNIDTWGAAGGDRPWAGVRAQGLTGRPTVIVGNVLETKVEPEGSAALTAILVQAAVGQVAHWNVTGNAVHGRSADSEMRCVTVAAGGQGASNTGVVSSNSCTGGGAVTFDGGDEGAVGTMRVVANDFNHGVAPPSEGFWPRGTQIANVAVGEDLLTGWVCVESGRPGEWRAIQG